jgi:hypothetical protein
MDGATDRIRVQALLGQLPVDGPRCGVVGEVSDVNCAGHFCKRGFCDLNVWGPCFEEFDSIGDKKLRRGPSG